MHTILWPQTFGTIFHYRYVQSSTWFQHISGKKNVVADAICRLRTLGLYQDNGNTDLAKIDAIVVDNVVEEAHATERIPNLAT